MIQFDQDGPQLGRYTKLLLGPQWRQSPKTGLILCGVLFFVSYLITRWAWTAEFNDDGPIGELWPTVRFTIMAMVKLFGMPLGPYGIGLSIWLGFKQIRAMAQRRNFK